MGWRAFVWLWARRRLLFVAISGLFFLVAGGRYVWLTAGPGAWGPRLACAEAYHDYGEVDATRAVEHDFVISNTGRKPLRILKAVPGCSACLDVKASSESILPGATATLRVSVQVLKLEKGRFTKKVLVFTNDPNRPRVILHVQGTVL